VLDAVTGTCSGAPGSAGLGFSGLAGLSAVGFGSAGFGSAGFGSSGLGGFAAFGFGSAGFGSAGLGGFAAFGCGSAFGLGSTGFGSSGLAGSAAGCGAVPVAGSTFGFAPSLSPFGPSANAGLAALALTASTSAAVPKMLLHLTLRRRYPGSSISSAPRFRSGGTLEGVRIATWNVNSVKQRVPRLLPWLDERRPDVVCLQETKLADDAFTGLLGGELADRGYEVAVHGEATWNGVAILSRVGLEDVVAGIADGPGFPHQESRAVSATCDGIRVVSVYVPNGREPDSEHYRYKLRWLGALREMVAAGPEATIVCGDMNIAPTDDDVFDPDAYIGQTHVTAPERAALAELQSLGLHDVVRDRWPNERVFTYWDYRAGMFHQDLGMRIDLVLATEPVAERVQAAWVDRHARKGKGPSDHAPVIVDLDEAPDGDIGPVVPPPSAPVLKRGTKKIPQAP
jgi:exodeoxyribonuclease-3